MSIHLYPEDCHAIDLLLDQGIRAAGGAGGRTGGRAVTQSASTIARDRLNAVQRVLGLLELMPAPEPPASLIGKTLALVEKSRGAAMEAPQVRAMRPTRDQPSA